MTGRSEVTPDGPGPRWWARLLLRVVTRVLPRGGGVRERYRQEVAGELWGLSGRAQAALLVGFTLRVPALRRAWWGVLHDAPHTPQWCWLRLHHQWRHCFSEDGHRYRRCRACGLDEDGSGAPMANGAVVAASTNVH